MERNKNSMPKGNKQESGSTRMQKEESGKSIRNEANKDMDSQKKSKTDKKDMQDKKEQW